MKNRAHSKTQEQADQAAIPSVVAEEESLLRVVLAKLDEPPTRLRTPVDDAAVLIELRDALAEAKPEDQGPLVEQMHRIEALSRQRGKGDSPPVDRRSPYFGHLRLRQAGRRRDVLIGQRGYVEPGGGVQIVDWRNAPISRLYYRYEEGDTFEERLGEREVEGEILARRTVTIVDTELRRVASAQGIFAREPPEPIWRSLDLRNLRLGVAQAVRGPQRTAAQAQLGFESDGRRRTDRFLPAIAALIDPRQFEILSRPSSGIIVVQGSAGSGKTTIGLHRIAYLNFIDPDYFKVGDMLVIVYQRALAAYVSRVLPELEVPGVKVRTFAAWANEARKRTLPALACETTDRTPALVMRAKSHGAMLGILADRQSQLALWCRQTLESLVALESGAAPVLAAWDQSSGPVDVRVTALARFVKESDFSALLRTKIEACGARLRARTRDVVAEWASLLTDRQALGDGFAKHAAGLFSESQLDSIRRWCSERERLRSGQATQEEDDPYAIDVEDEALLLRIHQLQRGSLQGSRGALAYRHLMVDEVQDFAPVELAVLLDSTSTRRSITLAGDTNQGIAPEHGFTSWPDMLGRLGLSHECVEPLRTSYRSTRQIVEVALHVLGPLLGDERPQVPRSGAAVEGFRFGSSGEACEFLVRVLRDLVHREPLASVALIARHPEQARLHYEALAAAEVPALRLVADQDFCFRPGIDVTDVKQTKGLEFDIVILLEANQESYPENDHARRLLHVAMTRAAHQLWITCTGEPSPLLPAALRR